MRINKATKVMSKIIASSLVILMLTGTSLNSMVKPVSAAWIFQHIQRGTGYCNSWNPACWGGHWDGLAA